MLVFCHTSRNTAFVGVFSALISKEGQEFIYTESGFWVIYILTTVIGAFITFLIWGNPLKRNQSKKSCVLKSKSPTNLQYFVWWTFSVGYLLSLLAVIYENYIASQLQKWL